MAPGVPAVATHYRDRVNSSRRLALIAASAAVVMLAAACTESTPPLAIGDSVVLASETLEASLTVTGVTATDWETLGLTGLFSSAPPDGVPWVVDYRIDLASGTRPDFSWDAVPTLSSEAWTAETSGRADVIASPVNTSTADWCPGYVAELPDNVVGTYCRVFVLPEGEELDEVRIAEVATWAASAD